MKKDSAAVAARLERLLPRFRKVRVAVLGDLMLDRYLWGNANRLSPEAAVPVVDFVSQSDCLGGAANVAANLAALGAQVQLFGVLGGKKAQKKTADDEAGAAFRAKLREAGVADAGVFADPSCITTVKTRIIARHHHIVRVDHERLDALNPNTEERLFRSLLASLKHLDVLIISDYGKGLLTDALAARVLHACHQFKVPVFVKPRKSRKAFICNGASAVVCNREEAGMYLDRPVTDDKSIEEAGGALLPHFGCAAVVITRGEKGMSVLEETSPRAIHIPATSFEVTYARVGQPGVAHGTNGRQVFDVTGAGDTVLSVLSLASAAGASLPDAAHLANIAAGVVVGKLGTATVTPAELQAALREFSS
jgi:D-beta-D-heptose 7-phosphate kinase/D-beta-D-heptose 1-phosphate adenosyltransferase